MLKKILAYTCIMYCILVCTCVIHMSYKTDESAVTVHSRTCLASGRFVLEFRADARDLLAASSCLGETWFNDC